MRARELVAGLAVCLLALAAAAQNREDPSTPEERKRAVQVTRRLEQNPLGAEATADRKWLANWIIDIPDISVPVCDELLKPALVEDSFRYHYAKEIISQQLAGSMVYLIEHPQDAKHIKDEDDVNDFAINKAGLESALKAYDAIVKSGAKEGRWAPLDELSQKRKAGQLDAYIRTATLKCLPGETVIAGLRAPTCLAAKRAAR